MFSDHFCFQFEAGEDEELSKDVTVQLDKLFTSFSITAIEEVTLGANLNINKLNRFKWTVQQDNTIPKTSSKTVTEDTLIKLTPMQIRTFILDIVPK
jgi:lysosomal alpha-mannosidase